MQTNRRRKFALVLCAFVCVALFAIGKGRLAHAVRVSGEMQSANLKRDVITTTRRTRARLINMPLSQRVLPEASLPPLPETFKDTAVDGEFFVDPQGHLVISESALRLFNYFFSAKGQEPEAVIVSRIVHEIERRLESPAREEATKLFEDFLAYRDAGRELASEMRKANPEEQVEALYALRREAFGKKTADTLFQRDEAVRTMQMARTRVLNDDRLSASEKRAALDEIDRDLPEQVRARREQSLAAQRAYEDAAALRAKGADPQAIHAARARALGEEAATRLRAIDEQEAAFRRELEELKRLSASLDDVTREERRAVTQGFIDERFPDTQRLRARAQLEAGFPLLDEKTDA